MGFAWIKDGFGSAVQALATSFRGQQGSLGDRFVASQLAHVALLNSGMLRKVIRIPAEDRVREWRDWNADPKQIEAIEKEEKRLGLIAKVLEAEKLRGVGGGALILAAPGDPSMPINVRSIGTGGLAAVNVVSRWEITPKEIVKEMTSPDFRKPAYFEVGEARGRVRIHPSRVVPFCGETIASGVMGISDEDLFWGDCRLQQVYREVCRSDDTQLWFSELVKKAKLLRIGIPNLEQMDDDTVNRRVELIATGESTLNATVFRSGAGTDDPGETIEDYQITWAGIPAIMDAFDQRVSAVADIPFTRLMGRSPAGMNSTGQHDTDNWNKMVASGQKLELRPCLESFDEILLRSAGVAPEKITWKFAPLDTPTEKEVADTFKTEMEAVAILQNTGAIPDEAFVKGVQNLVSEREYVPGLDKALAEIPEAERFPDLSENEPDPSALTQEEGGDPAAAGKAPIAAKDAAPRTLYVSRKLLNATEFIAWAKGQGFDTTTPAEDLHVTVAFSRTPVDWMKMGDNWSDNGKGGITVPAGGARIVEPLGDKGAVVLLFASSNLSWRHEEMIRNGASHDFDQYQPHVTITYRAPEGLDLSKVEPFRGKLEFGPEIFAEVVDDWEKSLKED